MRLDELKPNPDNPRVVTDAKLSALEKALAEFGDLSGIVFNRTTGHLVSGHQRHRVIPKNAKLVIKDKYSVPTKTGTVAEGYIEHNGERHKFREVEWDAVKEKAAAIAANHSAGEWDLPKLSTWFDELTDFSFDIDLTLFDENEIDKLFAKPAEPKKKIVEFNLDPKSIHEVVVTCKNEREQKTLYDRFSGEGLTCRVLSM